MNIYDMKRSMYITLIFSKYGVRVGSRKDNPIPAVTMQIPEKQTTAIHIFEKQHRMTYLILHYYSIL